MNQKAIRYFLITGAALVWGVIIYRVVAAVGGDDMPAAASLAPAPPSAVLPADSFSLYANYPDPFIPEADDTVIMKTGAIAPLSQPAMAPSTPPAPVKVDISFIQYHGMIYNPAKKIKTALLSIRGKETALREKESAEEVMVKKIEVDKVMVVYMKKAYTVYVQK